MFNQPKGVEVLGERMWNSDTRNHRIVLHRLEGLSADSNQRKPDALKARDARPCEYGQAGSWAAGRQETETLR